MSRKVSMACLLFIGGNLIQNKKMMALTLHCQSLRDSGSIITFGMPLSVRELTFLSSQNLLREIWSQWLKELWIVGKRSQPCGMTLLALVIFPLKISSQCRNGRCLTLRKIIGIISFTN